MLARGNTCLPSISNSASSGAEQPGRRVGGVGQVGDAVEQHGELVAAEARDRVGRPDRLR